MTTYLYILLDARRARMDQRGAMAVEYGLILAGLVLVILPVTYGFVHVLHAVFQGQCNKGAAPGTHC